MQSLAPAVNLAVLLHITSIAVTVDVTALCKISI